MPSPSKKSERIADERVREKTGKGWAEWFALLDRAGAAKKSHKEIAAYLYDTCGCPSWWGQMITVTYEREHGLREKNQAADGYQVSVSRTVPVAVSTLFKAWEDAKQRRRWVPAPGFTVRAATTDKVVRLTWAEDGNTAIEVRFVAKGPAKSQVAVEHRKLSGPKDLARMRAYWSGALDKLQDFLTTKS